MCIELGNIRIRIGFAAAVFFALIFNTDNSGGYVISLLFAVMHELVHLLFMFICGIRKVSIDVLPGGICIRSDETEDLNYKKTALCILCAPLFNLIIGCVCFYCFKKYSISLMYQAAVINLILGIINLVPLSFLDGGRALRCIISERLDEDQTDKITEKTETGCLILGAVIVAAMIFVGKFNFILFVFYAYCVINCIRKNRKKYNISKSDMC